MMHAHAARSGWNSKLLGATVLLFICPVLMTAHAQQTGTIQYHYDHYLTSYGMGELEEAWESVQWILQNDPFFPNDDDTNYRWGMQILLGLIQTSEPNLKPVYIARADSLVDRAIAAFAEHGVIVNSAWWIETTSRLGSSQTGWGPLSEREPSDSLVAVVSSTGSRAETSFAADGPWLVAWWAEQPRFNLVVTSYDGESPSNTHYLLTTRTTPEKGSFCITTPGTYRITAFSPNMPSEQNDWNVIVTVPTVGNFDNRADCVSLQTFPVL